MLARIVGGWLASIHVVPSPEHQIIMKRRTSGRLLTTGFGRVNGRSRRLPLLAAITLVLTGCSRDEATLFEPTPDQDKDQPPAWEMAQTMAATHAAVGVEATIDFLGIGLTGTGDSPFGFVQKHTQLGFTLVDPSNPSQFAFILWREGTPFFTGSAALANASLGVSRLTQHDDIPFKFISIDLGRFNGLGPSKVTFTGVQVNGEEVKAKRASRSSGRRWT